MTGQISYYVLHKINKQTKINKIIIALHSIAQRHIHVNKKIQRNYTHENLKWIQNVDWLKRIIINNTIYQVIWYNQ